MIFIGGFLAMPGIFAYLHINDAIAIALAPILAPLADNLVLLILALAVVVTLVRFVIVSANVTTLLIATILLPFCAIYGIHPFLVAFALHTISNTWFMSYNCTTIIASIAATEGKMVVYKDIVFGSVIHLVASTAACLIALPIWRLMGLW